MALKYPENTENYKYDGTISFTAFEEATSDISVADLQSVIDGAKSLSQGIIGTVASVGTQALQGTYRLQDQRRNPNASNTDDAFFNQQTFGRGGRGDGAAEVATRLADQNGLDGFTGRNFQGNRALVNQNNRKNQSQTVTLYLPQGLVFSDGVTYDNFDLGQIGQIGLNAVRQGRSLTSGLISGGLDALNSFGDALMGTAGNSEVQGLIGRTVAARAARRLGSSTAAGVATTASGVTVNPNKRSIMKGPNIRTFSFTFTLIPSSPSEAIAIKEIVRFFRTELYPEDIVSAGQSLGYKIPRKFDIKIKYDNKEIATKILPSFLQSVQTTYNPNSMSFHKGGDFSETSLTLNFVEERALNKLDITGSPSITQTNPELRGRVPLQNLQKKYDGGF